MFPRDNQLFVTLREQGPCTADELPHKPDGYERFRGVRRIDLSLNSSGSGTATPGVLAPVYYLAGVHLPRQVIAAWAEAHREYVETSPRSARQLLKRNLSDRWAPAVDHVLPWPRDENPTITTEP